MSEVTQRRLAAIVVADVAGYSRLMGADEEGTLAALKMHRRELVDPKIGEHNGRIVKTTGDGMLLEFASVLDAVRCFVAVQQAMTQRNSDTPADRQMLFRVGINLGDIIIDGDDIHGDGVNIAARLEALAEPGGIRLSDDVFRQVRGRIEDHFEDDGKREVKNIAEPVHVWRWSPRTSTMSTSVVSTGDDRPSIAVLPFDNMSTDPELELFDVPAELGLLPAPVVGFLHPTLGAAFRRAGRRPPRLSGILGPIIRVIRHNDRPVSRRPKQSSHLSMAART